MSRIAYSEPEAVEIPDRPKLSEKRRLEIYVAAFGRCEKCTIKVGKGQYEIDHVEQRWLSGKDGRANLRVLCIPCHKKKSAEDAAERAKVRGMSKLRLDQPSTRSAAWGNKRRPMERAPRIPAKRGRHD